MSCKKLYSSVHNSDSPFPSSQCSQGKSRVIDKLEKMVIEDINLTKHVWKFYKACMKAIWSMYEASKNNEEWFKQNVWGGTHLVETGTGNTFNSSTNLHPLIFKVYSGMRGRGRGTKILGSRIAKKFNMLSYILEF